MILRIWAHICVQCTTIHNMAFIYGENARNCKFSITDLSDKFCLPNFGRHLKWRFGLSSICITFILAEMHQKDSSHQAVVNYGCLFLCCCWLAGADTIAKADEWFTWAVNEDLVDSDSAYVKDRSTLPDRLCEQFRTIRRSGYPDKHGTKCGWYHWTVISDGVCVYNPYPGV